MTSKKLLFSKALFLNNLKRFKWGSILYAIILFFSVPFSLLVENIEHLTTRFLPNAMKYPLLLRDTYIIIPVLLAMVVPTIAAALIFNSVHSVKQSVFVHSLPTRRGENYVSDILSGLLMMAAPVLLNGAILLVMSFSAYGEIISSASVVYWTFLNLAIIFIMFSVAAATAFLTGNTATHIGINIFVQVLPLLVALTVAVLSEEFLFGFVSAENFVANRIMKKTPLVWLFNNAINYYPKASNIFCRPELWIYAAGAAAVYFCGYLLYRKRKVELSGDVVAFSVFRPIFKYLVTASTAAVLFAILVEMGIKPVFMYIEIAVGAAIVYFASEMLMNKSFRVFGYYKGFLVFLACGAAFLSFFAYTSVFGYETRIPESNEIESAAVHTGRYFAETPFVASEDVIELTREFHSGLIEDIPVRESDEYPLDRTFIYISYKLKNGKELRRSYFVPSEIYKDGLSRMYTNSEYKLMVKDLDEINVENVRRLDLSLDTSRFGYNINVTDGASEIMRAIEKDVSELSYNEIETEKSLSFRVRFDMTYEENEKVNVFVEDRDMQGVDEERIVRSFEITVNDNFKNTIEVLKKYGYYDEVVNAASNVVWILKKPVTVTENGVDQELLDVASGKIQATVEKTENYKQADCQKLYSVDGRRVVEEMIQTEVKDLAPGEYYYLFLCSNDNFEETYMPHNKLAIPKDEIYDYLEKYIEK